MAKSHGRSGVMYLGANTAVPVAYTSNFDRNTGSDYADASSHGDNFKQYVPGLLDYQNKVDKWYDDAYFTMWDAALARTALRMYDYPDRNNVANYFYGFVYVSADSLKTGVNDVNGESWSIRPASDITFKHT